MARPLSLHHLVALEITAAELVRIAAELGCEHVCLFTLDPGGRRPYPAVTDAEVPDLKALMDDHGITVCGLSSFPIAKVLDFDVYEAAIARGAALGASYVSTRPADGNEARMTENFGRIGEIAAGYGITPCLEFGGYGVTDALPQAVRIVRGAGSGKVILDALHVVRTGTTMEDARSIDPAIRGYIQLCDGPREATAEDYAREGGFDRLPPGEGMFPLRELLALIPADRPVSLEVPMERARGQGMDAWSRAKLIIDASRRVISEVDG